MGKNKLPEIPVDSDNKCDLCVSSICCSYVTHEIETPRSKYEFEHLLWHVSHDNVGVYKDEGVWYLMFTTKCGHLLPNGHCGIYDDRPEVCREYTNDYCEYDAPSEDGFELYFPDYPTLLKYCKKRFKKWKRG